MLENTRQKSFGVASRVHLKGSILASDFVGRAIQERIYSLLFKERHFIYHGYRFLNNG